MLVLQENEEDLPQNVVDSGLSFNESCPNCGHDGRLLRMSQDFYPLIEETTSPLSYGGWWTSGSVGSDGRLWMRRTSESRNVAGVCSLSEVLQEEVLSKYYLSVKAAMGILRRAEQNNKTLPMPLLRALLKIVQKAEQQP